MHIAGVDPKSSLDCADCAGTTDDERSVELSIPNVGTVGVRARSGQYVPGAPPSSWKAGSSVAAEVSRGCGTGVNACIGHDTILAPRGERRSPGENARATAALATTAATVRSRVRLNIRLINL